MDQREVERLQTTFDGYARDPAKQRAWRATNPGNRAIRAEVVDHAFELAGGSLLGGEVLDVGCGSGWWLADLRARGVPARRLHGVDLLTSRVDAARRQVPGATVLVADAGALPFRDSHFAAITLFLTLSSVDDRDALRAVLREARRVSAPGGAVIVWEPRVGNPRNGATLHVGRRLVGEALGTAAASRTVTVLPALARRLPTERAYRRVARLSTLRTHRLSLFRT